MAVACARLTRARLCSAALVFAAAQHLAHSLVPYAYRPHPAAALRANSGLIGYSLRAQFAARRFWTLSVWEDEAVLQAFVTAPPHAAVMKALPPTWTRSASRAGS
jgi:hypothetical protein